MTGQELFKDVIRENTFPSELYRVFRATLWIFQRFLQEMIEQGHAPILYHIGFSRNDDSIKSRGLVSSAIGESKGRKVVYFSHCFATPDPKCKPYFHMKNHDDLLFVINLFLSKKSERQHLTLRHSSAEVLVKIVNIKDGTER